MRRSLIPFALALLAAGTPVLAQAPRGAVDGTIGHASFIDDGGIPHTVAGGGGRFYLTPKLTIGPELVYMVGPGSDRDLTLNGTVTYDFIRPRARAVSPFVVAGAGLFRHSQRFGPTSYSSTEGSFTAGGGVRVWITDRVYAAGDVRTGWEPHLRFAAVVGARF